jgi:hypothetical protein
MAYLKLLTQILLRGTDKNQLGQLASSLKIKPGDSQIQSRITNCLTSVFVLSALCQSTSSLWIRTPNSVY